MTVMITNTILLIILTGMCALSTYIMFKQHQRNSKRGKERLEEIIVNDARVIKKDVVACNIFAQQTEEGVNLFTNAFIDFARLELTAFCIPYNDEGGEEKDLVKLFLVDIYTLEQKEYIVKYDNEYIIELLNKFTK